MVAGVAIQHHVWQCAYGTGVALQAGLTFGFDREVTDAHTALARGSGEVEVLATPQVLAWCEEATVAAISGELPQGEAAVGMRVRMDHVRPTPIGANVTVHAELIKVEGRRLTFEVEASDSRGEIASGQVIRIVVDHDRVMKNAGR